MDIVFASHSAGKIKELSAILAPYQLNVIPQENLNVEDIEETGLSFVENAILKARNAALTTNLPAIADDSGLEIDALNGEPGIYSARYSGQGSQANIKKALAELKNVPEEKRIARFQCVMVFMRSAKDPTPLIAQGSFEGRILTEQKGEGGFGYDPIFYVPEHDCAAAELAPEQKNKISHRAKALQSMVKQLQAVGFVG